MARIGQKLGKPHSPTRIEGSVKRLELLANFWQIAFSEQAPGKGKSENSRVIIGDLMVGLGGLEPPTSPLSGAEVSEDCAMIQKSAVRTVNGIVGTARLGANLKHHT